MMGPLLVLFDVSAGSLGASAPSLMQAVKELRASCGNSSVVGLLLGEGAGQLAPTAVQLGCERVMVCEAPELKEYNHLSFQAATIAAIDTVGATVIVAAASSTGKDLMPRLAATKGAGQASDIIGVGEHGRLRRPMYAGDIIAEVSIETPIKMVTVRASAFSALAANPEASGSIETLSFSFQPSESCKAAVVGRELSGSERPELAAARVVVSGGRALGSAENFEKVLYPLADALGAAVGASRAAVDSGYAPNDWQVGQTGKIVAPDLYIAVGISGAIQHLAGMKGSKVIVAINKDGEAPIFESADYGLVGDLFQIVPELTQKIAQKG